MPTRPFISYAREDRETAVRLRNDLLRLGATPWIDAVDLLAGADWQLAISRALRESSHVLVLLSQHSVNKRGYVQKEVREALDILDEFPPDKIFIIPVRLDSSEPGHVKLRTLHWVDMFNGYDAGLEQIARSLGLHRSDRAYESPHLLSLPHHGSKPQFPDIVDDQVLFDEEDLRRFLLENKLVRFLDRQIATFTEASRLHEARDSPLTVEMAGLRTVGFRTLDAVEIALGSRKNLILEWAAEWLGGESGPVGRGVSLMYLAYAVLAEARDLEGLEQYIRVSNIAPTENPRDIAINIVETYQRLRR